MPSFIASAVLAASVLSQAVIGASLAHPHAKFHEKKSVEEKKTVEEKRWNLASNVLEAVDDAVLSTFGCLQGANFEFAEGMAVGVGNSGQAGSGGNWVMELANSGSDPLIAVVWSGVPYSAFTVNVVQPNVTYSIAPGTSQYVSFNTENAIAQTISGGVSAIIPGSDSADNIISEYGGIKNRWVEYTFTTASSQWGAQSTVDISDLWTSTGSAMKAETFATTPSASTAPACTADENTCVYKCANGADICDAGSLENCSGPNTNGDGVDNGGCTGFGTEGGYLRITFS